MRCNDLDTFARAIGCRFTDNSAAPWGGALAGHMGGICLDGCYLADNSAGQAGGGIGNFSHTEVDGCTFVDNSGGCGLIGAWPVDCAPTVVEAESWGQIKALYR